MVAKPGRKPLLLCLCNPSAGPPSCTSPCTCSFQFMGYDLLTWQKILPLGAMFFCILFNYTILRDTKVRTC